MFRPSDQSNWGHLWVILTVVIVTLCLFLYLLHLLFQAKPELTCISDEVQHPLYLINYPTVCLCMKHVPQLTEDRAALRLFLFI